jgi:hypothetical protein
LRLQGEYFPDWRGFALQAIRNRGFVYFFDRVSPFLKDSEWATQWLSSLMPFWDERWHPEILRLLDQLLDDGELDAGLDCADFLLRRGYDLVAIAQVLQRNSVTLEQHREDLALLFLAHVPRVALKLVVDALVNSPCPKLAPFLAVVDAEWSRRALRSALEQYQDEPPEEAWRIVAALGESRDPETRALAAEWEPQLPSQPPEIRRRDFGHIMELYRQRAVAVKREQHQLAEDPERERFVRYFFGFIGPSQVPPWFMSLESWERLLARLAANDFEGLATEADAEVT